MNVKLKFNVNDEVWVVLKNKNWRRAICQTCGVSHIVDKDTFKVVKHIVHLIRIYLPADGQTAIEYVTRPIRKVKDEGYYHNWGENTFDMFKTKEQAIKRCNQLMKLTQTKPE